MKEKLLRILKSKIFIIIVIVIVSVSALGGLAFGIYAGIGDSAGRKLAKPYDLQTYKTGLEGDKIHFLDTGSSDAILLESAGKFALIDASDDAEKETKPRTPIGDLVLSYVKAVAADECGKVNLDFVIGTHSHSDHIGGFDTIIRDPDVEIGRAYLKIYDSAPMPFYELLWNNQEVYDKMIEALAAREIPVISDIPEESFAFGNFTVTIYNGEYADKIQSENDNCMGVLLEGQGKKIFLAGDTNMENGDELRIAEKIGKVDLLKAAHHGYRNSNTAKALKITQPTIAVITNSYKWIPKNTIRRFAIVSKTPVFATGTYGGIVAIIGENITLYSASEVTGNL